MLLCSQKVFYVNRLFRKLCVFVSDLFISMVLSSCTNKQDLCTYRISDNRFMFNCHHHTSVFLRLDGTRICVDFIFTTDTNLPLAVKCYIYIYVLNLKKRRETTENRYICRRYRRGNA